MIYLNHLNYNERFTNAHTDGTLYELYEIN